MILIVGITTSLLDSDRIGKRMVCGINGEAGGSQCRLFVPDSEIFSAEHSIGAALIWQPAYARRMIDNRFAR